MSSDVVFVHHARSVTKSDNYVTRSNMSCHVVRAKVGIPLEKSRACDTADRVTQRNPFWTYRAWYVSGL